MPTELLPMQACPFEKTNLVTKSGVNGHYDEYRCTACGLTGRRYGVSEKISTGRTCGRVALQPPTALAPAMVKIIGNADITINLTRQFGINPGQVYPVVPAPADLAAKFPDSTWVWSNKRQEPVRLLRHEFNPVNA